MQFSYRAYRGTIRNSVFIGKTQCFCSFLESGNLSAADFWNPAICRRRISGFRKSVDGGFLESGNLHNPSGGFLESQLLKTHRIRNLASQNLARESQGDLRNHVIGEGNRTTESEAWSGIVGSVILENGGAEGTDLKETVADKHGIEAYRRQ